MYTISPERKRVTPTDQILTNIQDQLIPKINFFGGSWMFGEGLNDNETLPYFLMKYAPSYKPINHGFHGYGVHNALYFLNGLDKQPIGTINVLLTGIHHASRSSCDVEYSTGHPMYEIDKQKNIPNLIGNCKGRSSSHIRNNVYNKIKELVKRLAKDSEIAKILARYVEGPTNSEIELHIGLIEEMNRISIERGEKFIVLSINHPASSFGFSSYDDESINSRLKDKGVNVIDATLAKDRSLLDPVFYIHEADQHPSMEANIERAKILAKHLGFVKPTLN